MAKQKKDWLNDVTYKDVTIKGSTFEGNPYVFKAITLNNSIQEIYLPTLLRLYPQKNPKCGIHLLVTAMTHQEGFYPGSRSFTTNNPGNIGNTDDGKNKVYKTLEEGIREQVNKLLIMASGKMPAYQLGKHIELKPYYSKEIAKNADSYQKSPYVPGYDFIYEGKLEQFIKIYAVGARSGNKYLNTIRAYFEQNGIKITPETTLAEIVRM